MANMGTVEFTATLNARGILTVIEALEMLVSVAEGYGHSFTPEQQVMLDQAAKVCELESLVITAGQD